MRESIAGMALAVLLWMPAAQAQGYPVKSKPESGIARAVAAEACAEGQRLLARRSAADVVAALRRFERAIATDANYAPAFAGLAEARALLYDYPGAKEAAQQALALDDGSWSTRLPATCPTPRRSPPSTPRWGTRRPPSTG